MYSSPQIGIGTPLLKIVPDNSIGQTEVELMHTETIHALHAWVCGAAECSAATEEVWTRTNCT